MRKLWIFFAAVFLLSAITVAVLHTPPVRRHFLNTLRDYLRENHRIELKAAELDYNLFRLSFTLEQFSFRSTDASETHPFLSADRAYINLSVSTLIRNKIEVEEAVLEGASVHLRFDEGGSSNIPLGMPRDRKQPAEIPDFLIHSFKAAGPNIIFEDPRSASVRIHDWQLSVAGSPAIPEHEIDFRILKPGEIDFHSRRLPIDAASLQAQWSEGRLQLTDAAITLGKSRLKVTGDMTVLPEPDLDFRLDAGLHANELARFITDFENLSGNIELEAGLTGTLQNPHIRAHIETDALEFDSYKNIMVNTDISWNSVSGMLRADPFTIQSPLGVMEGNASLASGAGSSWIRSTFKDVDMARISELLDLELRINSTASGSIEASWPGQDWKSADGGADVQLIPQGRVSKQSIPIRSRIGFSAVSGRYHALIQALDMLGTVTNGVLSMDRKKNIEGTLVIVSDDLASAVSQINTYTGADTLESPVSGQASASAALSGTLDNPELGLNISVGSMEFGGIRDVFLQATAGYARSRITIEQAALYWQGQSLRAGGHIGLEKTNPEMMLEIQGEDINIHPVLGVFMQDPVVEGLASLNARATGPIDSPSIELELETSDLKAYGEAWGQLAMQAAYREGSLEIKNFLLSKNGSSGIPGTLSGTGYYRPDTDEYSFEAELGLELKNLKLPDGKSIRGGFRADLNGSGFTSNPSAQATLNISELTVDSRNLGDFNIRAQVGNGLVTAETDAPRLGINALFDAAIQYPYAGSFIVKADISDLTVLSLIGPGEEVIGGYVSGTLQGRGEFADWRSMEAGLQIDKAALILEKQEIKNLTPISISLKDRVLYSDPARILAGHTNVDLSGSLPLESSDSQGNEFIVDIKGELKNILDYFPDLPDLSAGGNFQAEAVIRGGLDRPEPSIAVTLLDGEVTLPDLPESIRNIDIRLTSRNGEIVLDRFTARWGEAMFNGSAVAPLGLFIKNLQSETSGGIEFEASIRNLNPGSFPGAPQGLNGEIDIKVKGKTDSLSLDTLSAQADFEKLKLSMNGLDIEQNESSRISLLDGRLEVDRFRLEGGGISLAVAGTAPFNEAHNLDLTVTGKGDAGLFTSLTKGIRAAGAYEFLIDASGTIRNPEFTGYLTLRGGKIITQALPLQGEDIDLALKFTPGFVEILEGTGILNGGVFNASGGIAYEKNSIKTIDLTLDLDNLDMNFPEGLRTLSNSRIHVGQRDDQILVEGKITITDGSYRKDLDLGNLLSSGGLQFVEDRNPFLSRIRYNVKIETAGPVVMDNRQAKFVAESDLTLVGTFYRPSITGRLKLEEGGEIRLAGHRYILNTGIVDFVNESRIEPSLDILANTNASGYDINLRIEGTPGRMETAFTSDPPLPEPDILSVLLTGRTLEETRGAGLNIARQQAISYLTGQLGGRLSRSAEETLGISRVRIEPNLVSGDSNPGARLTLGQDLRRDLRLIYSMNLVDSSDQILIGEYDLTRRFSIRGTNQYDNSRRLDFQHDLRFGREAKGYERRDAGVTINGINLTGNPALPDAQILDKLRIRAGQTYNFLQVKKGIDRLLEFYSENRYLEARIRQRNERSPEALEITFNIDAGLPVEFGYEGFDIPNSLREKVRSTWESGAFDAQRIDDTRDVVRRWLVRKNYFEANVLCTIQTPGESLKKVLVTVQPGKHYRKLRLLFDGAGDAMAKPLKRFIHNEPEGIVDSIVNPGRISGLLEEYYRQSGYSVAGVDVPRLKLDSEASTAAITFNVNEGPLFHVGHVEFSGHEALSGEELLETATLKENSVFDPKQVRNSIEKLEELYWSHGYNNVVIDYRAERDAEQGEVTIHFLIDEKKQSVIGRIDVADNKNVDDNFIRNHLKLKEGDILRHQKTELSRRALYKTGSFELVELETEPIAAAGFNASDAQVPLLLRARVREVVPYKIRYGGFYDTDRGPGAIFDFENRNSLLGGARLLGSRFRFDSDLQVGRGYFGQPLHFKFPSVASATVFAQKEEFDAFTTKRFGFTLQHELELRENMILSYGYRFENTYTSMPSEGDSPPVETSNRIASLTGSFSWSTRDEIMDATRGFFLSNALEYAPSSLGSDQSFIKYFGQIFRYIPLSKATEVPFNKERKRPRFVYAGGVRIGLAGGLGGNSLPESERFFAGGGTTIRGFDQNAIGLKNELGNPAGGEAVFVVNNELRFPLISVFEGVGFLDFGNVYSKVSDFNPTDIRSSAGPGIRVRTPYFLLRFDYGFKLDRKPEERPGDFYFSIGQTF